MVMDPFDILNIIWRLFNRLTFCAFCFFLIGKANRTFLDLISACKAQDKLCAFYHPYCDGGGGGERVLWMMVDALLQDGTASKNLHIVIYSGSKKSKKEILKHAKERFSIDLRNPYLSNKITFVKLWSHVLTDAKWYPVATMICQCVASIIVGVECVLKLSPDFYIDTTGAAFTYPIFRVVSWPCKVLAYVHYPIISSDMLAKVREQRPNYNNSESISKSTTISTVKLAYYSIIASFYGFVGRFATEVMVNSSWTKNHIDGLWQTSSKLIYPPCNTAMMEGISLEERRKEKSQAGGPKYYVVSVGQFRPEKDHFLQLRAWKTWTEKHGDEYPDTELVIIGSTRNQEDEYLQSSLESRARELGLQSRVRFVVNAPFKSLMEWMAIGHVGLHTMWNEHFGISVVEMMAAGLVTVAHDSGGPRGDIVVPALRAKDLSDERGEGVHAGYLAGTPEEFATCLQDALDTVAGKKGGKDGKDGLLALQQRARTHVGIRFSDSSFTFTFQNLFRSLLRRMDEEEEQAYFTKAKAQTLRLFRSKAAEREAATRKKHD